MFKKGRGTDTPGYSMGRGHGTKQLSSHQLTAPRAGRKSKRK